ncbi:MAG: SCO family protein [Aureliella sp.]
MLFHRLLLCTALVIAPNAMTRPLSAQLLTDLPPQAVGIDVEDQVGQFIPLGLKFVDERGTTVGLGRYFKKGKPIVLTLNYSDCPGLCIAQLDNLVSLLKGLNGAGIGDDFEIVTVSIDPTESPRKAAQTKEKYVGLLRNTKAAEGWHFLTGKSSDIKQLADAVGFRYTYDAVNKRYNHPAATYFISDNGRICRYLLSLGVEPDQFKLAIGEAREGVLSASLTDTIIQFCYLYDPEANRYSANARRIMAFGGAAFTMLLAGFTAPFWFTRKRKPAEDEESLQADADNPEPKTTNQ